MEDSVDQLGEGGGSQSTMPEPPGNSGSTKAEVIDCTCFENLLSSINGLEAIIINYGMSSANGLYLDGETSFSKLLQVQSGFKRISKEFEEKTFSKDHDLVSEKLDSIISSTLSSMDAFIDQSECLSDSTKDALRSTVAAFVQLLTSKSVAKLVTTESGKSFLNSCATYFSQLLNSLAGNTKVVYFADELHLSNASDVSPHDKALFKFSLVLPILQQLGKFTLSHPEKFKQVLEENYHNIFCKPSSQMKRRDTRGQGHDLTIIKLLMELLQDSANQVSNIDRNSLLHTISQDFHMRFQDWIKHLAEIETQSKGEILSYLTTYVEYLEKPELVKQFVSNEQVLKLLRESIMSHNSVCQKKAVYILKAIISFVNDNPDSFFEKVNANSIFNKSLKHILIVGMLEEFREFWSTFFELLDIFSEKQIHIIEPCLEKLDIFNKYAAVKVPYVLPWYLVLLNRLCNHDNRFIVSQGIQKFLDSSPRFLQINNASGSDTVNSDSQAGQLQEFVSSTLFPVLKENVGWVFQDGSLYFKCTKQLGLLLLTLNGTSPAKTTEFIMTFIVTGCKEKIMSPNSLFFLTTTLCQAVFSTRITEMNPDPDYSMELVVNCIDLFCQYLSKGLATLDKFLKYETFRQLADLFCRLLSNSTFPVEKVDAISDAERTILRFVGLLNLDIFCNDSFIQFCRRKLSSLVQFTNEDVANLDEISDSFTNVQLIGIFRIYFCAISDNDHGKSLSSVQNQLNSIIRRRELLQSDILQLSGYSEFLTCVIRQKFNGPHDKISDNERWIALLRLVCHSVLDACLEKMTWNFLESSIEYLHLNCLIMLVEKIIFDLPNEYIKHLQLKDVTERLQVRLDSEESQWGKCIFCDDIRFRLFRMFAKLSRTYKISIPETFRIVYIVELLRCTELQTYKETNLSTVFKTKFQETKLQALMQIFQKNFTEEVQTHLVSQGNDKLLTIWESIIDFTDASGPKGIIHLLEFASTVLRLTFTSTSTSELDQLIDKFLQIAWTQVFEMRKTEGFWIGYKEFLQFIIQPYFVFLRQGTFVEIAIDIFAQGDRIMGLPLLLMEQLAASYEIRNNGHMPCVSSIVDICIIASYFGPLPPSNMKTTVELWSYLRQVECGQLNDTSDYHSPEIRLYPAVFSANQNTKIWGILLLMKILNSLRQINKDEYYKTLSSVTDKLLTRLEAEKKERYFCNEITHRIRQRICQALLLLQSYFDQNLAISVIRRLLKKSLSKDQQPSVRYLLEWIIVKNLIAFPTAEVVTQFFMACNDVCTTVKRAAFGCNFATICMHTVVSLKTSEDLINFYHPCLETLAELSMGPHVTVQGLSQRIFEHCKASFSDLSVLENYSVIYKCVCKSVEKKKNLYLNDKLENNFYMKLFNPLEHYNAQTIFIYLPRLANVGNDELLMEQDLKKMLDWAAEHDIHVPSNWDLVLKQLYDQTTWHLRGGFVKGEAREMGDETIDEILKEPAKNELLNIYQKKITPWKYLPVSDTSDFSEEIQLKKKLCIEDGLIVVASLINKPTNLGGLCRTSEIFGVSKFVISSLKHIQDQNFQSLSVSSEKWVTILEVPKTGLRDFLVIYTAKGFTIFGIEQASDSIKLNNDFNFPKKSILLLGDEKFGIPPELLQQVDHCLEIPQVGITRSLNVHVSGALCIWQYASQHCK